MMIETVPAAGSHPSGLDWEEPNETRLDIIPRLLSITLSSTEACEVTKSLEELAELCYNKIRKRKPMMEGKSPQQKQKLEHEYSTKSEEQERIEKQNRYLARDMGAPIAISVAMRKFANSPQVQIAAMKLLHHASVVEKVQDERKAWEDQAFQDLAVEVGALEMCFQAMQAYPENELVQVWGVQAVGNLTQSLRNVEVFACDYKGGIELVISIMQRYPKQLTIQEKACNLLSQCLFLFSNSQSAHDNMRREMIRQRILKGEHIIYCIYHNNFGENKCIANAAQTTLTLLKEPNKAIEIQQEMRCQQEQEQQRRTNDLSGLASSLLKKILIF